MQVFYSTQLSIVDNKLPRILKGNEMHAEDISDYLIKNLHILAVKGDFAASMNGYGTNFATGNLQGTMSRVASFRS